MPPRKRAKHFLMFFFALFLLTAISCAPVECPAEQPEDVNPRAFVVAPGLRDSFASAAGLWAAAGCVLEESPDGPSSIAIGTQDAILALGGPGFERSLGVNRSNLRTDVSEILVRDDLAPDARDWAVAHELGHSCGCPDVGGVEAIMGLWRAGRPMSLTAFDAQCVESY